MTPAGAGAYDIATSAYAQSVGRALLESDLTAVLATDAGGRLIEFSVAAEELFARRRDEVLGTRLSDLIVSPVLRAAERQPARGRLPENLAILGAQTEQTAVRGDGTHFPVELTMIEAGTAEEPVFVGFVRDITAHRMSEYRLAQSRALLAEAEEVAGVGSFEWDLRSNHVLWSDGIDRVLGLSPGGAPPTLEQALELVREEDRIRAQESVERVLQQHERAFMEHLRIARPGGGRCVVELRGKVVLDDFGEPDRLVGSLRDVTDEVEARNERDLLSYVVESTDDAILTNSPGGFITSWNRGAERLYGYSAEEAIGLHNSLLAPPELADEQAELTKRVFAGEAVRIGETTRIRKDGSDVSVSLTISPVRDATGRIVSAAVIGRDVTERRRYESRLRALAEHDHLTGVFNRRRFEEELHRELSRASRSGQGGAVISVDLDGFKSINDTAGHAAGDTVLRQVAHALSASVRKSDVVARLGGDEFAILLPGADRDKAAVAAGHLLQRLHDCAVPIDGVPFRVTASIGVALFEAASATAEEMLVNADQAMYAAKRHGRDRIAIFTPEEAQAARADANLSWEQRIRHALDNDGLELHWQPIISVATGSASHGELLLRMRGGGKLIGPNEFLGAAERTGLIHAIDRWVVRSAIGLLAADRAPEGLPVSVNLSGETVAGDPDLLELIERELSSSGVDPGKLVFEVTETAAIANILEARSFAEGIHRLGARLALDDFGTGFGSFYHLKHLPVDFIKIDREFVHNLPSSSVDQRLVRSIVDVAQSLNIRTVAESVADDETVALLRELGVDYLQGFHVGEPVALAP